VEELSKFFGFSFSALLPLVNPLGDALVFLGLVGTAPARLYRALAKKIAISTTLFLLTIELIGTAMINFWVSLCRSSRSPGTCAGGNGLEPTLDLSA